MTPLIAISLSADQMKYLLMLGSESPQPRYRIKCSGAELSQMRDEGLVLLSQDREIWVHLTERGKRLIDIS